MLAAETGGAPSTAVCGRTGSCPTVSAAGPVACAEPFRSGRSSASTWSRLWPWMNCMT
jgi:hypothetical protein